MVEPRLIEAGMALAACPTAPGHEGLVRAWLLAALEGLPHTTTRIDEFGNLHARYEHASAGHDPVRLIAHMDHPGFVVHRTNTGGEIHFRGGVDAKYFPGQTLIFHHEQDPRPLGRAMIDAPEFTPELKRVKIQGEIPDRASFATWDLPRAHVTSRLFVSPACDDLAQVATVATLLQKLAALGAGACVEALFTRAEEVGFYGALAALKGRVSLAPMITLSLETSSARGFARLHQGPIIRVGDRLSVFDSRVTYWLETAFRDLLAAQPGISFQRLLMSGGACEGSVFHRAGFPTGALCVAMNDYHNMGRGGSLRPESISLSDWDILYRFLLFLATEAKPLALTDECLAERFSHLETKALTLLGKTEPVGPLSH